MPSRPPLRSINENIDYRAEQYHVQTEDDVGSFTTHLYRGGVIIATQVGDYTDKSLDVVREKMVSQHEGVKERLFGREFDEKIAALEAEKRAAKRRTRTRKMSSRRYRSKEVDQPAASQPPSEAPPPQKKRRRRDRTTEEVSALSASKSAKVKDAAAGDVPATEVLTPRTPRATASKRKEVASRDTLVPEEPRTRSRVDLPSMLAADSKLPTDATIVDIPIEEMDDTATGDGVDVPLPTDATLIDVSFDSVPEPESPIDDIPTRPMSSRIRLPRTGIEAKPSSGIVDDRADTRAEIPAVAEPTPKQRRRRVRLPSSDGRIPEVVSEEVDLRKEILARKAEQQSAAQATSAQADTAKSPRSRVRLPSSEAPRLPSSEEPDRKSAPVEEAPIRPPRVRLPSAEATKPAGDSGRQPAIRTRPQPDPSSEVRRAAPAATRPPTDAKRPSKAAPSPTQAGKEAVRRPAPTPTPAPAPAVERSVQELFLDYLIRDEEE